jgi:hypothetical protein
MLYAIPRHLFSWDFTVLRDGAVLAEVDQAWFGEWAEVTIGGQAYAVSRESILQGTFSLRCGDQVLARAQKAGVFSRAFAVDLPDRGLELKALSVWGRRFGLFEDGQQLGSIGPTAWLGRRAEIDLPGDIPLPVQVFLFWLVVVLWRRAASSSAAAGGAGS